MLSYITNRLFLLQDFIFSKHLLYLFESCLYLSLSMSSHQAEANKSVVRCNRWRNHWVNEDAFLEKIGGYHKCLCIIADIKRYDWCRCITYLTTHAAESIKSKFSNLPKVFLAFWLFYHDVEGLACCRCRCWRDTCSEDVAA